MDGKRVCHWPAAIGLPEKGYAGWVPLQVIDWFRMTTMDPSLANATMLHDVFICHAGEDKEEFVRPLAEALRSHHLDVWYDEFALDVGDSFAKR